MSGSPLSIKLNCKSWQQLSAIHSRDLCRGAFFLKTPKPPPLGTIVRISLTLPSGSTVELAGQIQKLVGPGGFDGRGPGIDISIRSLPQSVMWLIESALSSAGLSPDAANTPKPDGEASRPIPATPTAPMQGVSAADGSLEEGHELVNAEADLVKALWQELAGMSRMNAFQLLDLPYAADDDEVRNAFQQLSKKYHPDRFTRYQSFEIRELANEVFILLRDAYRAVADQGGRERLLRTVQPLPKVRRAAQPPPLPPSPPPRAMAPEIARSFMATESAPEPQHSSTNTKSQPISFDQEKAPPTQDNRVEFALRFLESGQYEQALRILRVEARKDPDNFTARAGVELAAGRLALADGDRMEATERFEAALEIDPSNERAACEIAELRRYATTQRRGLLSKLMKKV